MRSPSQPPSMVARIPAASVINPKRRFASASGTPRIRKRKVGIHTCMPPIAKVIMAMPRRRMSRTLIAPQPEERAAFQGDRQPVRGAALGLRNSNSSSPSSTPGIAPTRNGARQP